MFAYNIQGIFLIVRKPSPYVGNFCRAHYSLLSFLYNVRSSDQFRTLTELGAGLRPFTRDDSTEHGACRGQQKQACFGCCIRGWGWGRFRVASCVDARIRFSEPTRTSYLGWMKHGCWMKGLLAPEIEGWWENLKLPLAAAPRFTSVWGTGPPPHHMHCTRDPTQFSDQLQILSQKIRFGISSFKSPPALSRKSLWRENAGNFLWGGSY